MLFGMIIDFFCKIVLVCLAVIAVACVIAAVVLMIGEIRDWWK